MRTRLIAGIVAAALVGCAGGNATLPPAHPTATPAARSTTPPPPPPPAPVTPTSVAVSVTIDGSADTTVSARQRAAAAGARAPRFISPSTLGVSLAVNGGAAAVYDVSSGSPLCTSGSPRTCTMPVAAAAGSDSFLMRTYDTKPAGAVIPVGARLLGTSTIAQTIVANTTNTVHFYIAGQIAGISATSGYSSLPADGISRSVGVTIIALDAGANTITAGVNDPYANTIALALAEAGGAGHSHLVVNGANVGTSSSLSRSTDTVAIVYDGAGSPGYTTTLGASAAGAGSFTFRLSPLYVSGSFIAANRVTFTSSGQVSAMSFTEANATPGVGYSAVLSGCAPNASLGAGSGGGASYAVNLTDVNAPYNGAGCSVTASDSLGTSIVVPVTFPTPAQDCAELATGTQIDPNTVANGSPCPIIIAPASPLTIYTPSDASHPGSGTFTVSERNAGNLGFTSTGSCSQITLSTPLTNGGPMGTSQTYTVTATAQSTANISCNLVFSDSTQTATATIIVDPAGTTTYVNNQSVTGNNSPNCFDPTGFGNWQCTVTSDGGVIFTIPGAQSVTISASLTNYYTTNTWTATITGPATNVTLATGGNVQAFSFNRSIALPQAGTYTVNVDDLCQENNGTQPQALCGDAYSNGAGWTGTFTVTSP
jgi:hypothetical protein